MKKKFFGVLVVVAIAVGAMINVNLNKVSNKGDLTLANVEVLAQAEIKKGDACYKDCKYDVDKPDVTYCGTPCVYSPRIVYTTTATSTCP